MEIIIKRNSNGIHRYLKVDIIDTDKSDIVLIKDIMDIVKIYNDKEIKDA